MTDTQRVVLGAIVAAIVGFAIGAGWQYSSARAYRSDLESTRAELDTTRHELQFESLEATLGAATIEAQRGNYESARRLASDFFTDLQSATQVAPAASQPQLTRILEQRDAIITDLSRGNLDSGGVLAELFAQWRTAMGEPVGPIPAPGTTLPQTEPLPPATTTGQ